MYLLKPNLSNAILIKFPHLHSTMYLLKLDGAILFETKEIHLHSTMYLLKHVVLNDIILIS